MILLGGWYFTLGFGVIVFLGQLEIFQLVRAKGIMLRPKLRSLSACCCWWLPILPPPGGCLTADYRHPDLLLPAVSAQIRHHCRCLRFYPGPVLWRLSAQLLDSPAGFGQRRVEHFAAGGLLAQSMVAPARTAHRTLRDADGLWLHLGSGHWGLCGGAADWADSAVRYQP
jgi:hypothetical protein